MTTTIVVIDDNREFLDFMTDLLSSAEYHIVTHADPCTALDVLRRERPHLLIVDIAMPGRTGWSIIDEMRANQETKGIPIIVCTAAVTEIAKREQYAEQLGVEIIAKPFGVDELFDLVEASINKNAGLWDLSGSAE